MENISIQSTSLRPEGDRVIDAPLIQIDYQKHIQMIQAEKTWKESDRTSITLCKTANLTVILLGLHKKTYLQEHKAKGDITLQVLKGEIEFIADNRVLLVPQGQMVFLLADLLHSVKAVKESFLLLTIVSNN